VHPFNLKSALLARHAQHVVLIHFPIGLYLTSVMLDFIAQWTKNRTMAAVAYYNLLIAAISCPPVLATGLMAWRWQLEGQRLKGILLDHLVLAIASSALIWLVWWLQFRYRRQPDRRRPLYVIPIEIMAAVLVALTAHLGGFLSGVNGPA
jgi:uncharacterized membrane protein